MNITKCEYQPSGHDNPISFAVGTFTDEREAAPVVSLFALLDNKGAHVQQYLPAICKKAMTEIGLSCDTPLSDVIWTFSTGAVSSVLEFSVTENAEAYHLSCSNIGALTREVFAKSKGSIGYLWSLDTYRRFYKDSTPLDVERRLNLSPSFMKVAKDLCLVPCQAEPYQESSIYVDLAHVGAGTTYFLADSQKLLESVSPFSAIPDFSDDFERAAYVANCLKENSAVSRLDFGSWFFFDESPSLTLAFSQFLWKKGGDKGLSALVKECQLPFLPVGLSHSSEYPNVFKRVRELSYGDTPICLGAEKPVVARSIRPL